MNNNKKDKDGIFKRFYNHIFGKNDDTHHDSKRQLFAQLLFTALIFLVFNVLTYNSVRKVISGNLSRNAENVFTLTQTQVENDLNNPKMYLVGFSQTIRAFLLNGISKAVLEESFTTLSSQMLKDRLKPTGFDGFSGILRKCPKAKST
jgi:hypothetical protein